MDTVRHPLDNPESVPRMHGGQCIHCLMGCTSPGLPAYWTSMYTSHRQSVPSCTNPHDHRPMYISKACRGGRSALAPQMTFPVQEKTTHQVEKYASTQKPESYPYSDEIHHTGNTLLPSSLEHTQNTSSLYQVRHNRPFRSDSV